MQQAIYVVMKMVVRTGASSRGGRSHLGRAAADQYGGAREERLPG